MPKIIENLRGRLIEEGHRSLLENSSGEISIRDIAKSCGIGLGTFYNYFPDKDSYIYEVRQAALDGICTLVDKLKAGEESFRYSLRQVYAHIEDLMKRQPSMLQGLNKTDDLTRLASGLEELIENAAQRGEIKLRIEVGKLAYYIILNIVFICGYKYIEFDEFYDELLKSNLEQRASVVKVYL